VKLGVGDDRVESPEDPAPRLAGVPHPVTDGLPERWPAILGHQRLAAREGCPVLAEVGDDPLVAVGEFDQGRSLAFATDIGPHWAPPEFLAWEGYARFWDQAVRWLAG
jgi:uncharacterized membrane protein